jgi:hypothetical protein
MSMSIDQVNQVISLINNARSYDKTVADLLERIASDFKTHLDNTILPTVNDDEILKTSQIDFVNLVSFIDKRNNSEAELLSILFGTKQAMRRANTWRFDQDYDYGNRLLDGTREDDMIWAGKDEELGTFTDTRAHYLRN